MTQDSRIVVALDYPEARVALALASRLDPSLCKLKIGKELFTSAGPALVEKLVNQDFQIFLDLKFHDIPNTVKKACEAATRLGVWMLNVHASGGSIMMKSAMEGVLNASSGKNRPYLIAVTVLTSMNETSLSEIGIHVPLADQVLRLAQLTHDSGLDGVVCSAQEASILRRQLGNDFLLVTPGIRPIDASQDDQSRIVSPQQAIKNGSSYLVIGRPITQAEDPLQALHHIIHTLGH